ncbi:MAG: PAS domain S-box protein [Gemmatimonadales bacterium]
MSALLCVGELSAQQDPLEEQWRWVEYGTQTGLPANRLFDLIETSTGTVWASSEHGLAWFDDFRWHGIGADAGLPLGTPTTVAADRGGNVLAIIAGRLYRGNQAGFSPIEVPVAGTNDSTISVAPWGANDLLVRTVRGLYRYSEGRAHSFPLPIELGGNLDRGARLIGSSSGRTWLSTRRGTFVWNGQRWKKHLPSSVQFLVERNWGGAAVLTHPDARGIWDWSRHGSPTLRYGSETMRAVGMGTDTAGNVVTATASGRLVVRRGGRWKVVSSIPQALGVTRSLLVQASGNVWAITPGRIFLNRTSSHRWRRWTAIDTRVGDRTNAILPTSDGTLWAATDSGVLVGSSPTAMRRITSIGGRKIYNVTGLAEDREGGIWISSGSDFPGAYRWFDDRWSHFGPEQGLDLPRVHRIVSGRHGLLWFLGLAAEPMPAADEPGVVTYDGERVRHWATENGLPGGRVYDFVEAPDGALWFGAYQGIGRWRDGETRIWTVAGGELANGAFVLTADSDGQIWFGDRFHGLGHIDSDDHITFLTTSDGLADNSVWSLAFAPDGALWIGTLGGVSIYKDGTFSNIGPIEGLGTRHVWPVVPLVDGAYIGTLGTGLYELSFSETRDPPPIAVIKPPSVNGTAVTFSWEAYAFDGQQAPERVDTRYRLDAGNWSRWGSAREAVVSNLTPGRHTFFVEAKGLLGRVSNSPQAIDFRIPAPFYRNPLFIGLLLLWLAATATGGGVFWRYSRRQRQLLKRSEFRFRRLFEESADAIYISTVDGRLADVNPAFERLLGYHRDELLQMNVEKLYIDPADRRRFRESVERDGSVADFALQLAAKDGSRVDCLMDSVVRATPDGSVVGYQGIIRDVTEHRRAERRLRESEERYRRLVEASPLGIVVHCEGKIVFANESAASLLGAEAERIVGMPVMDLVHPDYRADIQQRISRIEQAKHSPPLHRIRLLPVGGGEIEVETFGLPFTHDGRPAVQVILRDISESHRVEQTVKDIAQEVSAKSGNEFFESLVRYLTSTLQVDYAFVGIIPNDDLAAIRTIAVCVHGNISDNFRYSLAGTPCENVVGRDMCAYRNGVSQMFPQDSLLRELDVESYVGTPLFGSTGEALGLLVVMHRRPFERIDLSKSLLQIFGVRAAAELEHQREHEQRSVLEAQLRQSQKMEAIGTLAGGIAHDFNNILLAILGYAELARDDIPADSPAREDLEHVLTAAKRAEGLVKQILAFSRRSETEFAVIDFADVLHEALDLLRATLPSTIEIERQIDAGAGFIAADTNQIHQIILNLGTNAAHAIDDAVGLLHVTLSRVELAQHEAMQLGNITEGSYLKLVVRDTGTGMDEATASRIFDPFFTTKEVGKGTGLGLSVVHGIVLDHGGAIRVASAPGLGTTFDLYFPRVDEPRLASTAPSPVRHGGDERILLVDDEEALVALGKSFLEKLGYRVVAVTDSRQALELFRTAPDNFDLVLTDQTMPGLTGLKLAHEVRRLRGDIPIMIASGFSESLNANRLQTDPIARLLTKPYDLRDLAKAIRGVLDQSKGSATTYT